MQEIRKLLFVFFVLFASLLNGCSDIDMNSEESIKEAVELGGPRGEVNDSYPGSCGLYVDKDGNDICDLSE